MLLEKYIKIYCNIVCTLFQPADFFSFFLSNQNSEVIVIRCMGIQGELSCVEIIKILKNLHFTLNKYLHNQYILTATFLCLKNVLSKFLKDPNHENIRFID